MSINIRQKMIWLSSGKRVVAMLQIIRVDVVDGQTLDIELNNGHLVLFNMQRLLEADAGYQCLRDRKVLPRPGTDGQSIFWRDGPRLTLADILTLLNRQEDNEPA